MEAHSRFIRQIQLPEIGIKGQEKLSNASVLMIGAGGLGCPVLLSLTAMGLGRIGIVDNDIVSLSNLPRQTLFGMHDIGKYKTDVAIEHLRTFSTNTKFENHKTFLNQSNVFELISNYDIIIDGTDNFITSYILSDACSVLNKPLVYGGIYKYEAQVSVFNFPDEKGVSTNIRHLFKNIPDDQNQISCDIAGVINPLTGITGNLMSAEVLKIIVMPDKVHTNKVLNFNLLNGRTTVFKIIESDFDIVEMPTSQLEVEKYNYTSTNLKQYNFQLEAEKAILLINEENALLIDIRDEEEGQSLPNTFLRSSLLSNEFLLETAKAKPLIIACASGFRSQILVEHLRKLNPETKTFSLKGGVNELMKLV